MSALAVLPLRERGVQNTIEFVLSVHPSNSRYEPSAGGAKGAGMSHEALNAASRLLSAPPGGVPQERWFSSIAPQLFSLLEGEGEPDMDRAAAFIIGFGILGRKQYGAPGMPGWKAFAEPMLRCIDPSVVSASSLEDTSSNMGESIITLRPSRILVSSLEVARSLKRLTALVTSHPHPSLTKRLLQPILLCLWSLSRWPKSEVQTDVHYRKPAKKLLRTLLQLSSSTHSSEMFDQHIPPTNLTIIIQNLMFNGKSASANPEWIYGSSSDGGVQIQERLRSQGHQLPDLAAIDGAVDSFIDLIKSLPDLDAELSHLFMNLCKKWLTDDDKGRRPSVITQVESQEPNDDMENRLVEATVLQKMMTEIPEKLVSDSRQVLDLVNQVLSKFNTTDDEGNEDIVAVALSLLNIVFTSHSFRETAETEPIIENIQSALNLISKRTHLDISSTARNLLMLIKFRSAMEPDEPRSHSQPDQQVEDRKSYNLAMSYLTAADSPPPVRVQGLELISNLVRANSAVLDIPALLILFSSLLQDGDEYIYLRAIKSFIQLSERHPKAVLKDLIDRYVDPNEDYELDQRLRIGEALLQVIQNSPLAFCGEIASSVSQGLLSIAGRRGLRPKTEQAQEKTDRLKRKKDKEAEDAWDGEVPQLNELLENESQEDYEAMSQIVSGWESKRGTEDVRIRASAVSVLASAIELNVAGIGSSLISMTVDLSIHILTLEPEPEKGILRRSAILLIMGFVRALDSARAEGRRLGFGFVGQSLDSVQMVLKYVEDTDNDGLVRQHARDVVESLQTWQMNALLQSHNDQTDIQELAGLSIRPGNGSSSGMKPRIEEIE
jgi:hypothetical protein